MTECQEDIGHLIAGLTLAAARVTELNLTAFTLSPLEYGVLNKCHRGEGNTVTELARIFPVKAPTMSRVVNKLVDRGLISRRRLSSDRRTVRLRLTREGRLVADRLGESLEESLALLMNGISDDERANFTVTAQKIMVNLENLEDKPESSHIQGDLASLSVLMSAPQKAKGLKNSRG